MTAVRLERLWVNRASDLTDRIVVPFWRDSTRTAAPDGDVRSYAGGRRRNVRGKGGEERWVPLLAPMTIELAEDLFNRAGDPQWFRDPLGGKVLGVFRDPVMTFSGIMTTARHGTTQHATITLSVTRLSGVEVPGA